MAKSNSSTRTKLLQLLLQWVNHTVIVQDELSQHGISRQLVSKYVRSGWVKRIGSGAYVRAGDTVDWLGGVYALQHQLDFKLHVAGLSALQLQGYAHYVPLGKGYRKLLLQHHSDKRPLPKWFLSYFKDENITVTHHMLFKEQLEAIGIIQYLGEGFQVNLSSPERAILEYFYLLNDNISLEEAVQLLEGLMSLRPNLLQSLLEACTSIRVKRLFLALSEYVGHPWFKRLQLEKITLGKGKRVFHQGGHYFSKYQISIPLEQEKKRD